MQWHRNRNDGLRCGTVKIVEPASGRHQLFLMKSGLKIRRLEIPNWPDRSAQALVNRASAKKHVFHSPV